MKQEATNSFGEGLIMDLNPLTTPNNVMTNALNATLITFNGNEYSLQNDLGNGRVETAKLPSGFVPVGVQSYGGVIYVASYNPQTGEGQLGSFPSPERNLTQDEISNKQINVNRGDFEKDGEIFYYYKRYDIMPEGMYLNPGDKFGLFITGGPEDILSYFNVPNARMVTFHPAVIDEFGKVNYIDDECKVDGTYQRGLIFGSAPELGSVDGVRAAFDKCIVYKGKRSGRLSLIVEIETLEDFIVSRGIVASRSTDDEIKSVGSTGIGFSDNKEDASTDDTKNVEFIVKFYCAGWPKPDNDYLHFTGVKFEGNGTEKLYKIREFGKSMMFAWGGFKKGEGDDTILKYKITPYTELGPCSALARTGIINFNLLGTGNIILNEWRYYVENNEIRINYGFDLNLLEGESVESVTFTFYDVFFNKVYSKPFICSSTINGNFNGSYNEVFTLPYDLKYTDTYKRDVDNHDYIYTEVLGGENGETKLQSNELIKNNFYLVKIAIKTKGLVTQDGEKDQTSIKEFYRFMYTNGIFNQEYIEGEIMNFSTIPVDPYEVKLKATTLDEDKEETKLRVEYISGVESNYNERDVIMLSAPGDEATKSEIDDSFSKSNLYEDWKITNAVTRLSGEIENLDSKSELTGNYYNFGEYNEGWLEIDSTALTADNVYVNYDNSDLQILNKNGNPTQEALDYIDLNNEEVLKFEDAIADLTGIEKTDATKILGEDTLLAEIKSEIGEAIKNNQDTTTLQETIEGINSLKDKQFYYSENENIIESYEEEGKDPAIKISDVYGRLIRRVAGSGSGVNRELKCKETRPCFYPGITEDELTAMLGLSVLDGTNISTSGQSVKCGYNYDGTNDIIITIGNPTELLSISEKQLYYESTGDDKAFWGYNDLMNALRDNIPHSACVPIVASIISKSGISGSLDHDKYGSMGFAGFEDSNNASLSDYHSGKFFKMSDKSAYVTNLYDERPESATCALWRLSGSSDQQREYAFINFGGVNYFSFAKMLQEIFSHIYIYQKEISRLLYVKSPARIGYTNIFNTHINIGVNLGTESELKIKVNESPVRLYKSKDPSINVDWGDFSRKNVTEKIKALTKEQGWSEVEADGQKALENDKWFKSVEDYTPGSDKNTVLQCSYLNIPFPSLKEDFPNENNEDGRENDNPPYTLDIENSYPVKFILEGLTKKEDNYYLTTNIELGGNMDSSILVDIWEEIVENIDSYVPIYLFIPGTSLEDFKIRDNVDSLGNAITTNQVYYLDEANNLIGGNSTYVKGKKIMQGGDLCGGKTTHYQGLFVPSDKSTDKYRIPVLNTSGVSTRKVNLNFMSNKGNGEAGHDVLGLNMYVDAFFDISDSYLINRGKTRFGTESTS